MRALSCNPPYGTLIAACERFPDLGKHIETRGRWEYRYRGLLLIHQTAGLGGMGFEAFQELCYCEPFRTTLAAMGYSDASDLPRGAIVAVCELAGVKTIEAPAKGRIWITMELTGLDPATLTERERAFGDYTPGRYAWLLANIRALPSPIRARGRELWIPDAETIAAVEAQLSASVR
jgi:activating signal cointegrator 1